jgi:hypothetical protein
MGLVPSLAAVITKVSGKGRERYPNAYTVLAWTEKGGHMQSDDLFSIIDLDPGFQALAKTKYGHRAIVMRGHKGGRFERPNVFYVFDGFNHVGITPYVADIVRKWFASGELLLLKGSIPDVVI